MRSSTYINKCNCEQSIVETTTPMILCVLNTLFKGLFGYSIVWNFPNKCSFFLFFVFNGGFILQSKGFKHLGISVSGFSSNFYLDNPQANYYFSACVSVMVYISCN
ncbi:hypothetical protein AQUCO_00100747v1 [Aquilegia coerulea]|uniref:Uncharacterized protein n=1 Tax=Aquilegia coerulea TaxID=218851 RepID=A0A2G5FC00_AQUCA|nr:hypothetical protein AQUCO_00100747v1 [Aquilegia coerulea]